MSISAVLNLNALVVIILQAHHVSRLLAYGFVGSANLYMKGSVPMRHFSLSCIVFNLPIYILGLSPLPPLPTPSIFARGLYSLMCARGLHAQAAPALALIADGWSEDGLDGYTIAAVIALTIGAILILAITSAHNTLYKTSTGLSHVGLRHGHDQNLAKRLLERMANEDSIFHGQWPHEIQSINDTSLRIKKPRDTLPSVGICRWITSKWYLLGRASWFGRDASDYFDAQPSSELAL